MAPWKSLESADIESAMYAALDNSKLGKYNYYRLIERNYTSIPTYTLVKKEYER